MGTKNSVMILADRMARKLVAEQNTARLSIGMDAAILAAHEVFGMGPGRAEAFRKAYVDAMEELAGMFIDDSEGDKRLEYAKAKRDEAIRAIVGEEAFLPFDVSYGMAYMDELRRIRVMKGSDDPSVSAER